MNLRTPPLIKNSTRWDAAQKNYRCIYIYNSAPCEHIATARFVPAAARSLDPVCGRGGRVYLFGRCTCRECFREVLDVIVCRLQV